jgi:hypothetical protein
MIAGMITTIILLFLLVWEDFYHDLGTYWPADSKVQHALLAFVVPLACVAAGGIVWIVSWWLS